jgi:hypothetical protein
MFYHRASLAFHWISSARPRHDTGRRRCRPILWCFHNFPPHHHPLVVGRPQALELQALELVVATQLAEQAPEPPAHFQLAAAPQALEVVVATQHTR